MGASEVPPISSTQGKSIKEETIAVLLEAAYRENVQELPFGYHVMVSKA